MATEKEKRHAIEYLTVMIEQYPAPKKGLSFSEVFISQTITEPEA